MLVCSISKTRDPTSIAIDLAEAAAARDAPGIESSIFGALVDEVVTAQDVPGVENNVFGALVDDPASVGDIVDAYLGVIMLEAASADTVVDADIPASYAVDITEATTAAETADGSVVTPPTTVTWDTATVAAVTLSGGNLVATNTGTTATNQGAHVAGAGKTTGKYYFEATFTTMVAGANIGIGVGTPASTYTGMGNTGGVTGAMLFRANGNIWVNGGSNATLINGGAAFASGLIIGIAVDFTNSRFWARVAPSGNWNGSGTANPATNTGGIAFTPNALVPFCTFGGVGGVANNVITANFGASSFTGAVPSGFTSGWPI